MSMHARKLPLIALILTGCASRESKPVSELKVSESNLKATVEKLVSFGTRNSISTKGNAAAAAWLKEEFEKIPRLQVAYHEFTDPNPKLKRGDQSVPQRNVIAT